MKRLLLFLLNAVLPAALIAQLQWVNVSDQFGYLPPSVKVFHTADSLNGRPFKAWYVEADLKDRKLEFTTEAGHGMRFKPSHYYAEKGEPLVVINGTFFSFATNQNLNVLIKDGEMLAYNVPAIKSRQTDSFYYPTRSAIGITGRKADVAWLFTDTLRRWPVAFQNNPVVARGTNPDPVLKDLNTTANWKPWKMRTAIGGGPVLIHNNQIRITSKEEQMFAGGENDLHPRTAMGYTRDRKLILLVVEGRNPGIATGASLIEEAVILANLGCVEALNLDGGGSSCMLVNGRETIKPSDKAGQREVPGVFVIKRKN